MLDYQCAFSRNRIVGSLLTRWGGVSQQINGIFKLPFDI